MAVAAKRTAAGAARLAFVERLRRLPSGGLYLRSPDFLPGAVDGLGRATDRSRYLDGRCTSSELPIDLLVNICREMSVPAPIGVAAFLCSLLNDLRAQVVIGPANRLPRDTDAPFFASHLTIRSNEKYSSSRSRTTSAPIWRYFGTDFATPVDLGFFVETCRAAAGV